MKHTKNLSDIELEIGKSKMKHHHTSTEEGDYQIIPSFWQSVVIFVCFSSMALALLILQASL